MSEEKQGGRGRLGGSMVRITGDGTRDGTRVEVDGELVKGVQRVSMTLDTQVRPDVVVWLTRALVDVTVPTSDVRVYDQPARNKVTATDDTAG